MEYAQLLTDTGISANWVMVGMMGLSMLLFKRYFDKIDITLNKLSEKVSEHSEMLAVHESKLANGVQVHITKKDA